MKNLMLKATVAAIATAFAGGAFATVDMQAGTGAVKFASELVYDDTNPLVGDGAGQTSVNSILGFGVSTGATRYIRLSFGNATLDGAAGALQVAATDNGTIVQGGAAGDNYVIYQFTASANRAAGDAVVISDPAGFRITSNGSPVTVTYRLHETAVDAVNNTNALYSAGPVNLVTFSPGLKYTITPGSSIANVTDGFKKFCTTTACTATTLVRSIGVVDYGTDAAVVRRDGTAVSLGDLVAATTKIVVTGDFSAANGNEVYMGATNDGACALGIAGTLNTGKTSADIIVDTTAYNRDICYEVDGTTVLPAQSVMQSLDLTAVANTTVADTASALLGTITRNGASTTALNVTDPANADQTFIRITNLGSTTGKITGTLIGQDGAILGTADTTLVAAAGPRSTTVFSASQLATAFGVTGWTGRAKLTIIGEFPAGTLRVQNLIRVPNGTLVNVGGDTSGAGN